ncbi:MAG TPA: carboxypeptidase-like regulatory domain-containing protein [Candidatus Thermoplasmatota archaeon]|nr:carboxypeptidase-like regulatory domain-containing protein [Candidatus Thermoplasmatota archaeon]
MRLPPALLVALVLAGCAASGPSDANALADDPSLGTLAGVVVDEAIRPVEGALVKVIGGGIEANATADAEGRFAVPGLQPGSYVVRVSKEFYSPHEQAVVVQAGLAEPDLVRFQLVFEPRSIPYSNLYKFEGMFECGVWPTNGCANVNIVTGIMLCSLDLPCFNATQDRSVELIPIDGVPTFLLSEMVWEPTTATGEAMTFGLGSATRQELQDGFADGHNYTEGLSPLMLTLNGTVMADRSIGGDRMLLIQVSAGDSIPVPASCQPINDHCGVGVSVQQPYTTYTHAFFGYFPPPGWLFTASGQPPPPP